MRTRIAIVLTAAVLVCILFVPTAFADQKGCTVANVKGTYGYTGFGTALTPNYLGLPAGTLSAIGTLSFDGKGNLLIIESGRINDFVYQDLQYPSTYTVTEQCVFTITVTAYANAGVPGPHHKGVFVNNRNELRTMSLLQGWIVNYVSTTKITTGDDD